MYYKLRTPGNRLYFKSYQQTIKGYRFNLTQDENEAGYFMPDQVKTIYANLLEVFKHGLQIQRIGETGPENWRYLDIITVTRIKAGLY